MDYSRFEKAIIKAQLTELESRIMGEIRSNPYHDPKNGRFTSGNMLTSGGYSGNIKLSDSDNSNGIAITQEAIDRVPKLNAFSDDRINSAIQKHSKDILSQMSKHELGTEMTISIALDDLSFQSQIGKEKDYGVEPIDLNKRFVSIHNHPSGKPMSYLDYDHFMKNDNHVAICVVGNDGTMYIAKKRSDYKFARFGIDLVLNSNDMGKFIEVQNGKDIDFYKG